MQSPAFPFRLLALAAVFVLAGVAGAASPGPTLVSAVPGGQAGNAGSATEYLSVAARGRQNTVSADGRYVVFLSIATNLTADSDTNGRTDIYRRDLETGQTELVSVNLAGKAANGASENGTISADGRYVCFVSLAGDLTAGDTNNKTDVFVRDLQERTTALVSTTTFGASAAGNSGAPSMTPDGRYVAFTSNATNLAPLGLNNRGGLDVYLRDLQAPVSQGVKLVSQDPAGRAGGTSADAPPAISDDGQVVAFSDLGQLLPADKNLASDVYARNLKLGATELLSLSGAGAAGNGDSAFPALSGDGRYVAYVSTATDLTGVPDGNGPNGLDLFVRDRTTRTTKLASVNKTGTAAGNGGSLGQAPAFSEDGRYVAWMSFASDLAPTVTDGNGLTDLYVRDLQSSATVLASVNSAGTAAGNLTSPHTLLSKDGHYCVFASTANNLVAGDANGKTDVFRRDLFAKKTELVSHVAGGTASGNGESGSNNSLGLSGDGAVVLFESSATNLAPKDSNFEEDVYAAAIAPATPPTPPALSRPILSPTTLPNTGGKVTVSIDVTSEAALKSVTCSFIYPDASSKSVTLVHQSGATYTGSFTFPANATDQPIRYTATFTAIDARGLKSSLSPQTQVTVAAGEPIRITDCTAAPALVPPVSGRDVTVSAVVTAAAGVLLVKASLQIGGYELALATLTPKPGNVYSGKLTAPVNGSDGQRRIDIVITAGDRSGHRASATCSTTQADTNVVVDNCRSELARVPAPGAAFTVSADIHAFAPINRVRVLVFGGTTDGEVIPNPLLALLSTTYVLDRPTNVPPDGLHLQARAFVPLNPNQSTERPISIVWVVERYPDIQVYDGSCSLVQDHYVVPSVDFFRTEPATAPGDGGRFDFIAHVNAPYGLKAMSVDLDIITDRGKLVSLDSQPGNRVADATYRANLTVPRNPSLKSRKLYFLVQLLDVHGFTNKTLLGAFTGPSFFQAPASLAIVDPHTRQSTVPHRGGTVTAIAHVYAGEGLTVAEVRLLVQLNGETKYDLPASELVPNSGYYQVRVSLPRNRFIRRHNRYDLVFQARASNGAVATASAGTVTQN